ncbi:MAG: hypothetical protein J7621_12625 [Niastella sp.]|nr:hypothetical protein [Niastella sp.]
MKTASLLLLMTIAALSACRKNNDTPPAPKVSYTNMDIFTYEKDKDNANTMVWYTTHKNSRNSLKEIVADKSIEAKVLFGYYKDDKTNGLYASTQYPVLYGQEKWGTKNNTVFIKPSFEAKDFYEWSKTNKDSVTVEMIDKACELGTAIGNKVTDVKAGDVFLFQVEGKFKGIVKVNGFYFKNTCISLETWIRE